MLSVFVCIFYSSYYRKTTMFIYKEEKIMAKFIRKEIEGDMPFDRFDMEKGFVHATGFEYWDPFPGCWRVEYEDDLSYLEEGA